MTRGGAALATALAVLAPRLAQACAVCQPGSEENRFAFIATTAFLTALPLVVVGSIVWWLRGRAIEMRRAEAREVSAVPLSRARAGRGS